MGKVKDGYAIAERFRHYLRVTDVSDGMDAVGRPDTGLVARHIRPLWMGMRFWGPAATMRVLPTNRPMPVRSVFSSKLIIPPKPRICFLATS